MSEQASTPPLILVDGSSYLYRAFHASERANLRTADGRPTGAIRVMTNMLRSLMRQYQDSHVAVIFDARGKNFRHDLYSEYKATRKPMPDDLRSQIEPIHHIVRALGLPLLMIEGVEADDVIGTLARQATEKKINTIISTGDKDIAQLVTEHVSLIDTMNDAYTDQQGVESKFGIPASLIIDYLALMGDSSDNIPGMPGVGQKTALALLNGIGSIDEIAGRLDEVAALGFRGSKNFAEKFTEHKDIVLLSRQLATIKTDVELPVSIESLEMQPLDKEQLLALFKEYEFRTLIAELEKEGSVSDGKESDEQTSGATGEYSVVTEETEFLDWIAQLESAELFAFDTETTSLDYMVAELVGVSFAIEPGKAAYVPVAHDYLGAPAQLERNWVLEKLKPLLEDPAKQKVGQNFKYDQSVLARYDIQIKGAAFDTMLESYCLNSIATRHNMDALAEHYLNHKTIKYEDIAGKGAKQLTFNQIELEKAGPYAAEDADITLRLHLAIWEQLQAEPALMAVFREVEMPLVDILSRIERHGALVDGVLLKQQSLEIGQRLKELEQAAHDVAGQAFNLSSPKQLQELLFDKLQLPVIKKTPKGQPSTAEEVLQELALDYELPKLILEHRSLSKLKSTYTEKLPQMINGATGRIHTSYHQAVTATGRLSSSDPNLQNIPIRTPEGRRVRQAFIAPEGYQLVAADYSQIELRIMAHLSGDKGLLDAFAHGLDIHKATAAEVFGVALDEVTGDQRRSAKAINFGLIYGMSSFGLAKQLGVSRKSAQEYIDLYFARYPGVLRYMETTKNFAREKGYVETILGRRLYLPEINARNGMRRQGAERTAINAPMQGTAADIIKKAMIRVDEWLQASGLDARVIMQVHDELVLEVANESLEAVVEGIKVQMSSAAELSVPLLVEAGMGDNWDEAH
ncbi:DNA polymerase I [Endozoicomonas sp. GU-1]|uniref:DNA polymerase I n=1 Tax=Endozoicomonas sp. GU-1 TaxID=3009078 RepID=UPI0022B363A4|nr:DNA polymerase I [Endozoicomonas sp. GU-1]WBA81699.1 DNA polymerase I [Endozoicomonas sp. GU-1]WBA84654.1 DNA polymerase I [Endozoicomonas sp. GU-1]